MKNLKIVGTSRKAPRINCKSPVKSGIDLKVKAQSLKGVSHSPLNAACPLSSFPS